MTMAKKSETTPQEIISIFTQSVLENESFPKSVYRFCKDNKLSETDFYAHYASIDNLKQAVWLAFYDNTYGLLHKNSDYHALSRRDRLLTFFYTFFEVLLLNRSYILFVHASEENKMNKLSQLKQLRTAVKTFASELIEEGNETKSRLAQNPVPLFSEATWAQLLLLVNYWLNDTSKGFEKTDALIEKSVTVAFEVFDNTRLNAFLDLGKFLWKETTTTTH